ncbi:hypothetical protein Tco_1378711 [Tanacetum coccineum]
MVAARDAETPPTVWFSRRGLAFSAMTQATSHQELDKVEEAVDGVADRVEEIAEKVEEFVGDIADDLPEGSQLRQTLEKVEMVADTIGKDAKMVSDIVDKMDEMEAKLETILDKANGKKTIKKVEPQ